MLQTVVELAEGNELEMAILGRQVHLVTYLDNALGAQAVGNQVLDGDDGHIELFGHLHQLWQTGHCAIGIDDFNQCGGRIKSRNAHQVNGGFGVACTLEHTFIYGTQGVDMSRTSKVRRLVVGVCQRTYRHRAVMHRHACGASLKQINGHGERGAQHRCVVIDLHIQVELVATLGCDGCTQHATAFTQHEIDFLLGNLLGGNDKVAFVLAILIIDHDDKFAAFELFHSLINCIQFDFFHD